MITPSFGVADAYGEDIQQYNNAVGFFMIRKAPRISDGKNSLINVV